MHGGPDAQWQDIIDNGSEKIMGCVRTGTRWRWPNRVIPYTINNEDFPAGTPEGDAERAAIQLAIDRWTTNTSIRIQPRNGELNWVEFVAGEEEGACSSHVGRRQFRGSQQIPCVPLSGTLVHEIGHAIGLWHEQSREDRGLNVSVFLENVRSDKRGNFDRHVDDGTDLGVYDYQSVMHYAPRTFAIDWRPANALFGQSSKDAPALAAVGGELHLVHLGEGSNVIYHSWTQNGTSWTQNNQIPNQSSKLPPALAVWNGNLHMVHLGTSSNDIWHSQSNDLRNWTANTRIRDQQNQNQKSKASPALASFNGELHMVHIGGSSNDIWHSWTSDGTNWTQQKILGQKSKTAPALASFGGELHMVHLGDSSNNLWHTWTNDGRNWTTNVRIPDQKSRATPALCEFNSQLHLAHIGDSSTTIWHSFFDINGWRPNNRRDNNQSRRGPALAAFTSGSAPGGVQQLHSMHLGKSSPRLWHTVRDTNLVTMEGPAGVTVGGTPGVLTQGDIDAVNSIYP